MISCDFNQPVASKSLQRCSGLFGCHRKRRLLLWHLFERRETITDSDDRYSQNSALRVLPLDDALTCGGLECLFEFRCHHLLIKNHMKSIRGFSVALLVSMALATLGCGPGETKVIEHTEHYQLSEQEEANKQAEIEARKNGGR